jgi:molecular chaperone DnaK
MAHIFGLDFGTTNSVAALIQRQPDKNGHYAHVLTDSLGRPHPSVVWYTGAETIVGRRAKDQMSQLGLGVFGDIVRSPKMYLGAMTGIHVAGVNRPAAEVVAEVLRHVRAEAIRTEGGEFPFDRAVVTVPVAMDGAARRELRQAALSAGIHVHQFVHEPLAALYGYLRAQEDFHALCTSLEGKLMLVFDWGGGTLDLTLCRIVKGALVQIMNLGDNEVGGDKFDLELVKLAKRKHAEAFPQANWLQVQVSAEARLIAQCEAAKISLSDKNEALLLVKDLLAQSGPERHLDVKFSKDDLVEVTSHLVRTGLGTIDQLLEAVGIPRTAIELCLVTGGMASMPAIREGLIQYFDAARVRTVTNSATIIAEGAAWIAHDNVRVTLAKPIEVLNADDVYLAIIRSGQALPMQGDQIQEKLSLYCVDPRDGKAKFVFARNRWPGREGPADVRVPYGCLCVNVDPTADPLMERLELVVSIDENCIARARAESLLIRDSSTLEITNLEFGLKLPNQGGDLNRSRADQSVKHTVHTAGLGSLKVRSNVTNEPHNRHLIPGELLAHPETAHQHNEKMYYVPCAKCNRSAYHIERFGCDQCFSRGQAQSSFTAEVKWRQRMEDYQKTRRAG